LLVLAAGATVLLWSGDNARPALAHCQMPCGIYDDPARVQELREDATTIGKATGMIDALAGKNDANSLNQAVRWVTTKEVHASHIQEVVADYFLTQRVKPVAPNADGYQAYLRTLADHHAVLVAAMKTKQQANPKAVEDLVHAIDGLAKHYQPMGKASAAVGHVHQQLDPNAGHEHHGN